MAKWKRSVTYLLALSAVVCVVGLGVTHIKIAYATGYKPDYDVHLTSSLAEGYNSKGKNMWMYWESFPAGVSTLHVYFEDMVGLGNSVVVRLYERDDLIWDESSYPSEGITYSTSGYTDEVTVTGEGWYTFDVTMGQQNDVSLILVAPCATTAGGFWKNGWHPFLQSESGTEDRKDSYHRGDATYYPYVD
jgi:hypothetical protein